MDVGSVREVSSLYVYIIISYLFIYLYYWKHSIMGLSTSSLIFENATKQRPLRLPCIAACDTLVLRCHTPVSDDILRLILRYTQPPVLVQRRMFIAEYRSVLKNVAWVRYHLSLPRHQQRRHIRTTAGQILFWTGRIPWERALFGYSRDIQHLRN
eukprot:COSAG01_NODE_10359_length_2185_cov_2.481304_2_plen_155_part_00